MMNLSSEVFNALSSYLSGASSLEHFRDFMVGLHVDKHRLLADADRLFVSEFEGRYAEFSDFAHDEQVLKSALASYVLADEAAAVPTSMHFWSFPSQPATGSRSISLGDPAPTRTFNLAALTPA
ncbi:MAG TPA: hypothetical protein VIW68_03840 [Candidatus Sulfotelmatobacter sp.]